MILDSSDEADIGLYTVQIKISLVLDPSIERVQTMTVIVDPCKVLLYVAQKKLTFVNYQVGQGPLTTDTYRFDITPSECGYDGTVEVTGGPAYIQHNPAQRRFIVDSDTALTENF